MDTFSWSMSMFFLNQRGAEIKHWDCLALRCCGFTCRPDDMKNWLIPSVSFEDSIKRINNILGTSLCVQSAQSISQNRLLEILKNGSVLGPVPSSFHLKDARSGYYDGGVKYYYCCGFHNGFFIFHDPTGFPLQQMPEEELLHLCSQDHLSIMWTDQILTNLHTPDYRQIARDCIEFKLRHLCCFDLPQKHLRRKDILAIQYGLINYLVQTNQLIYLVTQFSDCRSAAYDSLLQDACKAIPVADLQKIKDFENRLASLLKQENI